MKIKQRLATLLIFTAAALLLLMPNVARAEDEHAQLLPPPEVPPSITRTTPATVVVELTTIEKTGKLADGVEYNFWTFNGSTPGPFIRVRVGDTLELRLHNDKSSKNFHSIDLHAVTGPGGGAKAAATIPGGTTAFKAKMLSPGIFVYHCATAHIPTHIANGMYGLILVEPEGGLTPVDHEYYVMQGDFYTKGGTGEKGLQAFSIEKLRDERPTYVVFNGQFAALTGKNSLKAKVGDTVRLFVGNGGPNLFSSFHIIGAIFDKTYVEGSITTEPLRGLQTTLIPAAGAAIVEFKVPYPGSFILVDHSIVRAIDKGAVGILEVSGEPNAEIFNPIKAGAATSGH